MISPLTRRFKQWIFKRTWIVLRSLTILTLAVSIFLIFAAPDPAALSAVVSPVAVEELIHAEAFLQEVAGNEAADRQLRGTKSSPNPTDAIPTTEILGQDFLERFKSRGCGTWLDQCVHTCKRDTVGIPRIVHFIKLDGDFTALHWFAVLSAKQIIKPKHIIIHIPEGLSIHGCWWKKAVDAVYVRRVPLDELVDSVDGLDVVHLAHKADFLRLTILNDVGGIYMDMDAIAVKPIDNLLMENHAVVSKLFNGHLGNGMMLATPQSCLMCTFAQMACSVYNGEWDVHSVGVLSDLLLPPNNKFPEALVLEHHQGFFPFSWNMEHLELLMVHPAKTSSWSIHDNYALHFYGYAIPPSLQKLLSNAEWLSSNQSVAATVLRRLVDVRTWRSTYIPCAKADQVKFKVAEAAEVHEEVSMHGEKVEQNVEYHPWEDLPMKNEERIYEDDNDNGGAQRPQLRSVRILDWWQWISLYIQYCTNCTYDSFHQSFRRISWVFDEYFDLRRTFTKSIFSCENLFCFGEFWAFEEQFEQGALTLRKMNNRLKAEAKDLSRNKPSIKPEAAGRGFYARFISR